MKLELSDFAAQLCGMLVTTVLYALGIVSGLFEYIYNSQIYQSHYLISHILFMVVFLCIPFICFGLLFMLIFNEFKMRQFKRQLYRGDFD